MTEINPPEPVSTQSRERWHLPLAGLLVLIVAFAFQGSRGIWEPDEGRYVNAALEMLDRADGSIPTLHGLVYLDKPPMIYWSTLAGFTVLGHNEWGARAGHSLALAATALLVGLWAASSLGPRAGWIASAAYVTTLLPAVASHALTPDALLSLWTTLAFYTGWRYSQCQETRARWSWSLGLGLAVGLGILTKGTAALVFLAPVLLYLLIAKGPVRVLASAELWVAGALSLLVGLSWFWSVAAEVPGAAAYFFHNQVSGRLWEEGYHRNPEWWKPLKVYGVALGAGSLPWSLLLLSGLRPSRLKSALSKPRDPLSPYLWLGLALPLLVLSLATSRLELYVLPLLPLVVLLSVRTGMAKPVRWWTVRLIAAATVLVALKAVAGCIAVDRDSRALAARLAEAGVGHEQCVDVLETKAHGLTLYGFERVSWHTFWPETYPYFEAPLQIQKDLPTLRRRCGRKLAFVIEAHHAVGQGAFLREQGLRCTESELEGFPDLMLLQCRERRSRQPRKKSRLGQSEPGSEVTR